MHRLIDSDVVKEYLKRAIWGADPKIDGWVDAMPAADAAPVVHGRWKDNGNETVSCSRCATWFPKEREPYMLHCGCCGARMDGERRDEDG